MEKYEYFYDKNIKIQICLEKLETDIQKMGSLNAGGKFEWVDSILVKVRIYLFIIYYYYYICFCMSLIMVFNFLLCKVSY